MDDLNALLDHWKLCLQFAGMKGLAPVIPAPDCIELILALEAQQLVIDLYARHDDDCAVSADTPCDCGFLRAFESARTHLLDRGAEIRLATGGE